MPVITSVTFSHDCSWKNELHCSLSLGSQMNSDRHIFIWYQSWKRIHTETLHSYRKQTSNTEWKTYFLFIVCHIPVIFNLSSSPFPHLNEELSCKKRTQSKAFRISWLLYLFVCFLACLAGWFYITRNKWKHIQHAFFIKASLSFTKVAHMLTNTHAHTTHTLLC